MRWCRVLVLLGALVGCAADPQSSVPSTTAMPNTPIVPAATVDVAPATATQPAVSPTTVATTTLEPTPTTAFSATPEQTPTLAPSQEPTPTISPTVVASMPIAPQWSYPIAKAGGIPGDGFFIRHGFDTENTWYNPGYWHTGEDWYALDGDTAGAEVQAVAAGEVVYAGSNYPGRVVIVRHAGDIYSMYGHLDPALKVGEGQQVARGDVLGTVLARGDETPNHLHFEIRTFLLTDAVNGPAPRYDFRCGPQCAPGPGYWPIDAPELPDALGWRNPTHVIAERSGWMSIAGTEPAVRGEVVVASGADASALTLWGNVDATGNGSDPLGEVIVASGQRLRVLTTQVGDRVSDRTSATAYRVWYRVVLDDGRTGWLAALFADAYDTGSDGAPSSVRFVLLPFAPQQ